MGRRRKAETILADEDALRRIAKIIGPFSAAQGALDEAERRRKLGEDIAIYRRGDTLLVGPRVPANCPLHSTQHASLPARADADRAALR